MGLQDYRTTGRRDDGTMGLVAMRTAKHANHAKTGSLESRIINKLKPVHSEESSAIAEDHLDQWPSAVCKQKRYGSFCLVPQNEEAPFGPLARQGSAPLLSGLVHELAQDRKIAFKHIVHLWSELLLGLLDRVQSLLRLFADFGN